MAAKGGLRHSHDALPGGLETYFIDRSRVLRFMGPLTGVGAMGRDWAPCKSSLFPICPKSGQNTGDIGTLLKLEIGNWKLEIWPSCFYTILDDHVI